MLKLKGLDHFGIEVSDMERSLDFYAQTLGMDLHARFGHMSVMKCGDNDLALFERSDLPPATRELTEPRGRGHWAFRVSESDFTQAQSRFPAEDIPTHGPVDWGDHQCFYFLDPDGNLLELISYPE